MTQTTPISEPHLIQLAEGDNVLILASSIAAGTVLTVNGQEVVLQNDLSLGHKIAGRDIQAGEIILKYAFPIGVATMDIPAGAHVHMHNVASNYTPSYVVEAPE